jgi:undecaprenyl diphosphate synthase
MDGMNIPTSIGVVMDGNRRYAKARGISQFEGHELGVQKIKDVVKWAKSAGVKEIIIYGFSTENWNRASEEVAYLMDLFTRTFGGPDLEEIIQEEFRVQVIGERERLPKYLRKSIEEAEERTKDLTKGTLVVCISYGGRPEILAAVNELLAEGVKSVDAETLRAKMWSAGTLDPDLIIRTGGDKRLSNFLPWQSIYSELFFTDTYWPAFGKEEFDTILQEFSKRERRHGR